MALEDEIINIEDLDIATEIKIGDYVLLETTNGTKLLDFKDFVIGVDNITFFDRISGSYLQVSDISAISAKTLNNETLLSSISGVNTDINEIRTRIGSVEASFVNLVENINTDAINASDITSFINGTIGFTVSNTANRILSHSRGFLKFEEFVFSGTALAKSSTGDINLSAEPDDAKGFFYKAKGSYGMLFNGTINTQAQARSNFLLQLRKNGKPIAEYTASSTTADGNTKQSNNYNFSLYLNLVANDVISLAFTNPDVTLKNSIFSGIKI
tara:strand:- start:3430 stop:4242 length:813 start_codon:yes stop_codon:yes gene_type:complete